jgi:hypothetical protein
MGRLGFRSSMEGTRAPERPCTRADLSALEEEGVFWGRPRFFLQQWVQHRVPDPGSGGAANGGPFASGRCG